MEPPRCHCRFAVNSIFQFIRRCGQLMYRISLLPSRNCWCAVSCHNHTISQLHSIRPHATIHCPVQTVYPPKLFRVRMSSEFHLNLHCKLVECLWNNESLFSYSRPPLSADHNSTSTVLRATYPPPPPLQ